MTKAQWALTFACGIVVIPIRFITVLILTLLASLVARITLIGKLSPHMTDVLNTGGSQCSSDDNPILSFQGISDDEVQRNPITGWRRYGKAIAAFLGRLCFMACGFYKVTVYGEPQADPSVAPVLVAAPHSTYFDGFVVFWTNLPYIVSRVENMKIPLMGRCIALSQAIAVNREDPNSRGNTVKEIIRRAHLHQADDPEERYIFLLGLFQKFSILKQIHLFMDEGTVFSDRARCIL